MRLAARIARPRVRISRHQLGDSGTALPRLVRTCHRTGDDVAARPRLARACHLHGVFGAALPLRGLRARNIHGVFGTSSPGLARAFYLRGVYGGRSTAPSSCLPADRPARADLSFFQAGHLSLRCCIYQSGRCATFLFLARRRPLSGLVSSATSASSYCIIGSPLFSAPRPRQARIGQAVRPSGGIAPTARQAHRLPPRLNPCLAIIVRPNLGGGPPDLRNDKAPPYL